MCSPQHLYRCLCKAGEGFWGWKDEKQKSEDLVRMTTVALRDSLTNRGFICLRVLDVSIHSLPFALGC